MTELVGIKIQINPNEESIPYLTNENNIKDIENNIKDIENNNRIHNLNHNRIHNQESGLNPSTQKTNGQVCLKLIGIICFGIGILLFTWRFHPCLTDPSSIVLLQCQYYNYVEPYRCCEKTNCQCQEAPVNLTSCTDGFYNLTSLSECSDGNFCCQYDTHLCPYTYYEDCDCVNGVCQQCAIIGYQPCDPYCSKPINDRLCSNECGTCHQISTYYQYSLNNTIYNLTSSLTQTICSRDNEQCKNLWIDTHLPNNTNVCGFDSNDLNPIVTLNPNNPKDCFRRDSDKAIVCICCLLWLYGLVMCLESCKSRPNN